MGVRVALLHGVTDEELLDLSRRNPGWQFERSAEGELVMAPAGGESGRRSGEVFLQLGIWNRQSGLGVVFDASTGFNLKDGSCLSPAASWLRTDRWQALTRDARRRYLPLAPDAAFEVRSDSDALNYLRAKMRSYIANGSALAVLVDPQRETVEVFRPNAEPERHEHPEAVGLDPELPGFVLALRAIFGEG